MSLNYNCNLKNSHGCLVALYRAIQLRFGCGFEACDANSPRNIKNTNLVKQKPVSFLFVPKGACRSGLKVRRAKSAAQNPKIIIFFWLWFFELDLVGWSAMSVTRVFHEGCQAQRMWQAVCFGHICPLFHDGMFLGVIYIGPPHLT